MANIEFLHEYTEDGLRLQGTHWYPKKRKLCLICIHGMFDNLLENYYAEDLGNACIEKGYGFIFGHNRGYSVINDIGTKKILDDGSIMTKKIGTVFDTFDDCIYDIQLWMNTAKKLGYSEIILIGHSLGCNKVIYYISSHKDNAIKGVALISPPDIVGMIKSQSNYKEILNEAEYNVKNGEPEKALSSLPLRSLYISSHIFYNFFKNESFTNNIPIVENPEEFKQLAKIDVPILAIMGSNDNVIIHSAKEDLEILKAKAALCPNFSYSIIEGADHRYMTKSKELANSITGWVDS